MIQLGPAPKKSPWVQVGSPSIPCRNGFWVGVQDPGRNHTMRCGYRHCFSNTALLISDFALDVYGFVDRANVGTSLVANRSLNEQIIKLQHLLPVHHLMCEFEEIPVSVIRLLFVFHYNILKLSLMFSDP